MALADKLKPFASILQLDIMDGVFAAGISWPLMPDDFEGLALPHAEEIFWEVHLMAKEPLELGLNFIRAKARRIIGHVEALGDENAARDICDSWHGAGAEVGLSLLLETPISAIENLVHDVDEVQVMSIAAIGAQGRPFDVRAVARVRELRNRFPHIRIAVDGGVNAVHARELVEAGADRLCVGAAIMRAPDPKAAYDEIVRAAGHV